MNPRLYRYCLLTSVTLTGMAVLIIEITATRILAPHFGNSIFTFSSVISTILAALAVGYYLGGKLADRNPSERLFYSLIAMAGFGVLLVQLLNAWMLPRIAASLSMIDGPLIVSLLLFLLPALLLGMLSPYAIKLLHQHDAGGVGSAAGLVFFWSTLGSIAGSLGAGFWLIPAFGVGLIVISVGGGLILLAAAGGLIFEFRRRARIAGLCIAGLAGIFGVASFGEQPDASVVFSKEGLYERIVVRDISYRERPARILLQDRNINSGMFLDDGRMAFDYTRFFDLYRLFVPELENALAIGGGAYSVPKAILRDTPRARVDVAEIEPSLLGLSQAYFGLPDDPRLANHVIDGRRFLLQTRRSYDLVFVDVYRTFASAPMQFTTREFFSLVDARLAPGGVMIANFYGSLADSTRPLLMSLLKTMRGVFPQVHLLATEDPASDRLQNFIFIAHRPQASGPRDNLGRAAETRFVYPELRRAAELELHPDDADLGQAIELTDDYAPVEYYSMQLIRRYVAGRKSRAGDS